MDKKISSILLIITGAAIIFILLLAMPGAQKDLTGWINSWINNWLSRTIYLSCFDSDGGQNFFTKGIITTKYLSGYGGNEITKNYTDVCLNNNQLTEYFCSANKHATISYACPNGCSNGLCQIPCRNECTSAGLKQCSGNSNQTCGNYDADSCLEWSTATACPAGQICQNGNCKITSDCGNNLCGADENVTICPQDCSGCYKVQPILFYPKDYASDYNVEEYVRKLSKETQTFFKNYAGGNFIMKELSIVRGDYPTSDYWNNKLTTGGFQNNVFYELEKKGYPVLLDRSKSQPFLLIWVFAMGGGGWAGGDQFSNKGGYAVIGDASLYPAVYPECNLNCSCSHLSILKTSGVNSTSLTPPDWVCDVTRIEGAAVHELGHSFGLPHPDAYTTWTKNGLLISLSQAWDQTIMGQPYNFPDRGLLDEDIKKLKENFAACRF